MIRTMNLFATPTATVTLEFDDVAFTTTRVLIHNDGPQPILFWYKPVGQARVDIALQPGPDLNLPLVLAYTTPDLPGRPGRKGFVIAGVEAFGFSQ